VAVAVGVATGAEEAGEGPGSVWPLNAVRGANIMLNWVEFLPLSRDEGGRYG
jgi:hypothetical protein